MKREIITTDDGSKTIHLPDWNEQYHSKYGAIQEAKHVFIEKGLLHYIKNQETEPIKILEIGFGTGLNALITLLNAEKLNKTINYVGIEAYPILPTEIENLNYSSQLKCTNEYFEKIHLCKWEKLSEITTTFSLLKRKQYFSEINDKNAYHLIYFDAFGARVQPELWVEAIFEKMYNALKIGGVLVTYSAKGSVRRAMQSVGFKVERLTGPPGKREMLRAIKV